MTPSERIAEWVVQLGRRLAQWGEWVINRPTNTRFKEYVFTPDWTPPEFRSIPIIGGGASSLWNVFATAAGLLAIMGRYAESLWGNRFHEYDSHFRPNLPPPETILEGLRRGNWDEPTARRYLELHGLDDRTVGAYIGFAQYVPTAPDLVSFAAREAFEEGQVELLGLDTDVRELWARIEPWAKKAGLTFETWQLYWRSHWSPPTLAQAFELYHRDPTRYPLEYVKAIAKANEVTPNRVDDLLVLSFDLLPLTELRVAAELGNITPDGIAAEGRKRGLSPTDAAIFQANTEAIVRRELKTRRAPVLDLTRSALEQLVDIGEMSTEEYEVALRTMGYDPEEAEAFSTLLQARLVGKGRTIALRELEALYVRNLWTPEQVGEELAKWVPNEVSRSSYLRAWELDRQERGLTEEQQRQKDLTRTDLVSAAKEGVIEWEELPLLLQRVGFDPTEAATITATEQAKQRRSEVGEVVGYVREAYIAGQLTQTDVHTRLNEENVEPRVIGNYLQRWELERTRKGQQFTVGQVERLYKAGLMGWEEVLTTLTTIRYTEEQALLLVLEWSGKFFGPPTLPPNWQEWVRAEPTNVEEAPNEPIEP